MLPPHPRFFGASVLVFALAAPLAAQLRPLSHGQSGPAVVYDVSFPNGVHHEAAITATFTGLAPSVLHLRMARSSAGRYALAEFAKNVYAVHATDSAGHELPVARPDPYGWDVPRHGTTVIVRYTLFADRADGTYSGIDGVQAHLQPPATFMYARGLDERPIRLHLHRPNPSWTIATQLPTTPDSEVFTAPNLAYFFDSPIHLGAIQWREWTVTDHGRAAHFRVAVDDTAPAGVIDEYAAGVRRLIPEAAAVFGELPRFDYGTYTFVACYRVSCNGDGMEHRNSTSLTSRRSLGVSGAGALGSVAHEFFHAWNVKRIRPRSLEPFDNERANMSGELWLAEGFTQYYGMLTGLRAGVSSQETFLDGIGADVDELTNTPGRQYFGPIGMSQQSPFTDAAVYIDRTNWENVSISYYTYGAALALALDLELRARGKSLDQFMQMLWREYGQPEIPYTLDGVRRALINASGDSAFARQFWTRYIEGNELPDYAPLVARAGLRLRAAHPEAAWIGTVRLSVNNDTVAIASSTLVGSPLYEAGLDYGDRLLAIDGHRVTSASDVQQALAAHHPGEQLTITVQGRSGQRDAPVNVRSDPTLELVSVESTGDQVTPEQLTFRQKWLGPHARQ
jgi:predicted metalloprotease with PDZ domain